MGHIGIDVHKKESRICILAEIGGPSIREQRVDHETVSLAGNVDVLIVGAGPTGLVLALWLKQSSTPTSRNASLSRGAWSPRPIRRSRA